ncbi:phospholipase A2 inhibitor and Ly6/PLAUR domain-containing protein-like isoform X3 [Bubalus kerabau]|uniref:phospholipase A2 inhibitor and Ly6/PLAUR domain-containing protein-like isoform X3 n=1 Tax=Bubalus carabanensis TaxID=3119969 RepID=UPI00244E625C|nr:phospholipase A2 inhibitor and Ly6/PLAUR domain-containing protein-like isoform X3 [Bubalus carabanensis]
MKPYTKPETFLLAPMLLCTLLSLGYPLSREVCIRDGAICIGETKTCAQDEDTCIVITTETNNKGSVDVTSYKGCSKSSECDPGFLSITVAPENTWGPTRAAARAMAATTIPCLVSNLLPRDVLWRTPATSSLGPWCPQALIC